MNYKTIFVAFAILIALGLTQTSLATNHGLVDQSFTGPFTTGKLLSGAQEAQTFTPTVDNLIAVDLYLFNNDSTEQTATFTMSVKNLYFVEQVEKTLTLPPNSISKVRFDLASPLALTPNESNGINLEILSRTSLVGWAYNSDPNSYIDGRGDISRISNDIGDFGFATYYEANPQQQTQSIIDLINDFVNSGDLTKGSANSLTSKLDTAIQKMANNDNATAINLLHAFIFQVSALVNSGQLSLEDGQQLINSANAVILVLQ